jgi:PTS system N-acetylglucosamine-specific IIC component
VYYVLFRVVISRFNLKTLGRESEGTAPDFGLAVDSPPLVASAPAVVASPTRGASYLRALGGADNVLEVEACATRLRLSLVDNARIDEAALKQLGVRGVIRPATGIAQVIIGPLADQVADEIQEAMRAKDPSR